MPKSDKTTPGLYYDPGFITPEVRTEILAWIDTIRPIWETRYSKNHPPPYGESNRQLLRPVYWLGNWQFACLNYYHPPQGIWNRCVRAEPFPPVLAKQVAKIEKIVRTRFVAKDIPKRWHLNTCLVNFYGHKLEGGRSVDTARVGEHRDYEPGPVASISLGERAFFQFVRSRGKQLPAEVVYQQWLGDGSLQIFGGPKWKDKLFHRVQRVEKGKGAKFPLHVENFETRRINFTFRYVPDEHITLFRDLPKNDKYDVWPYLKQLAKSSDFFAHTLKT